MYRSVGPEHDWDNAEEDYDGSLPTTITNAKMVPIEATTDHYLIEGGPLQQRMTLGSFLYENETGPPLTLPDQHRTAGAVTPQRPLGSSRGGLGRRSRQGHDGGETPLVLTRPRRCLRRRSAPRCM